MASSLAGLPDFLIFFVLAIALVGLYLAIYTLATMHNEFALIRDNVISAATALGFSLVGFALPLASAIVHAQTIIDCLVWGLGGACRADPGLLARAHRHAESVPAHRLGRDGGSALPRRRLACRRDHQRFGDDILRRQATPIIV